MKENNRIEYKQELTPEVDIEKEVIAFLNTIEGGFVFIGIDKTGKVLGVADIDGDMLKIKDRIKNNISPSAMGLFDVVEEERDGKEVIKIIVAGGSEKPYFKKKFGMTQKGCYLRIGTAAEPMPQAMIDKLFATRTRNSIGNIKSRRQDLSFEQLRIYYDEKGKTLNEHFKTNLELLTEDGFLNYAAYLLADENGIPIKLAKFANETRVDLIEKNEYGYCSLIKATKSVLDKFEIENKTATKITGKERIEKRPWNSVAIREAVVNAIVHNDYTYEAFPKFEIFSDRIEITSFGTLPDGLSIDDFFEGMSIPRNKELMRIFNDLELVEQLGTGIGKILKFYGKECFRFTENFIRITIPIEQVALQIEENTIQVEENTTTVTTTVATTVATTVEKLLGVMDGEHNRLDLQVKLGLLNKNYFINSYLKPALEQEFIEMTIPDKPNSSKQKYRLTQKGKIMKSETANDKFRLS